ncbi:MerR family DNA-binding transcriptional regulator [Conexibacter stalactiti]|uniref:MerR family DNA-binding transcriptional regulator n=1 Tax=Conexibacter stalactiti TaxID=1940611 RepID=A0ABU4HJ69_9ACTN|nr:MerR family DNA-binding transcriptional regulator [Conexibacter stalactiti]MDW5593361.1 MerR family DNA-binding transcriptional regulator [Conexibacter stalactiti]MEC5034002.1 MerR family DNA-binding transcriptional regulator [Conexibacter stalactiti]
MRYLKTSEAAALLNVSPNTLRAWERRFGFPRPQRSPGRHRLYTHGEIAALRDALLDGLSISSAVSRAREGLGADTNALVGALNAFDNGRADAALEGALALRSLDRAVQEVLLTALDEVARRHGTDSVQWAFAARWGNSWLRRAQRLVSPSIQSVSVVLGDASRDDLDPDAAYIRALELLLARSGATVMGLSVRGVSNMAEALAAHRPDAVVIAGGALADDAVARWAYAVRLATGPLPVAVFRRGSQRQRVRTTGAAILPGTPGEAARHLMEMASHAISHPTPRTSTPRLLADGA